VKRKHVGQRANINLLPRPYRFKDTGIHCSLRVLFAVTRYSADREVMMKKLKFLSDDKALYFCPTEIFCLCTGFQLS
jgi:hypothetical protein